MPSEIRRPPVHAEIRLPGIRVGTPDVGALFKRRRDAGPFLIVARSCGLALDTAFATDNGQRAILWPPHGRPQQLWYLSPSGYAGEVLIVSADAGLALDATRDAQADKAQLREPDGAAWQRWTLQPAPDGAGHLIGSVLSDRVLTTSEEAQPKWEPWFARRDGGWAQQWLFTTPHGGAVH